MVSIMSTLTSGTDEVAELYKKNLLKTLDSEVMKCNMYIVMLTCGRDGHTAINLRFRM